MRKFRVAARSPSGARIILLGDVTISEEEEAEASPVHMILHAGEETSGEWRILLYRVVGTRSELVRSIPMPGDELHIQLDAD